MEFAQSAALRMDKLVFQASERSREWSQGLWRTGTPAYVEQHPDNASVSIETALVTTAPVGDNLDISDIYKLSRVSTLGEDLSVDAKNYSLVPVRVGAYKESPFTVMQLSVDRNGQVGELYAGLASMGRGREPQETRRFTARQLAEGLADMRPVGARELRSRKLIKAIKTSDMYEKTRVEQNLHAGDIVTAHEHSADTRLQQYLGKIARRGL